MFQTPKLSRSLCLLGRSRRRGEKAKKIQIYGKRTPTAVPGLDAQRFDPPLPLTVEFFFLLAFSPQLFSAAIRAAAAASTLDSSEATSGDDDGFSLSPSLAFPVCVDINPAPFPCWPLTELDSNVDSLVTIVGFIGVLTGFTPVQR